MKKKIIISTIIVIIVGIICGVFYSTISPQNTNHQIGINESLNSTLNESITNEVSNTTLNETPENNLEEEHISSSTNIETENLSDDDLFAKYYDKATEILSSMTLEEKVGQMFLARYPSSGVIDEIRNNNPGGYVLFGRDFQNKTKEQIKKELQDCQNASKIDLALGVDEEGGTVVRVSSYKAFRNSPFKSPRNIYASSGMSGIISDSHEKTNLLKSIGLNMNLAPVVDIPEKSSDFIYSRAFSTNLEEVRQFTKEIITTMKEDNITSVMKHFPGYGNNVDTHTAIAIDKRSYSYFENRDFIPFEEGINNGAPAILVSHNIVECMDNSKPASLSKNVHDILRNGLNFSGIVITDDLAMDAVKQYVENGEAATQAVLAGNDLIISSDFVNQKNEVLNAVKNGQIPEKTINTAVIRILAWKLQYEII